MALSLRALIADCLLTLIVAVLRCIQTFMWLSTPSGRQAAPHVEDVWVVRLDMAKSLVGDAPIKKPPPVGEGVMTIVVG